MAAAAALLAASLAIAACGSDEEFPPPAEPAASPEQRQAPAGTVLELPNGGEAEGIVADPETGIVAVATRDPDAIILVMDATGRAERPKLADVRIPESPRHMQLAAPGGPVLATAERTDDLIEVTLPDALPATGRPGGPRVRTVRVGDFPHDATAAGPPGDPTARIFVADEGGDTISVVEGESVAATLPAAEQPGGIANADGVIGVIAVAERVLTTYDAESLEETGEVEAGVGPTHLVAGDDGRFYVADTQGDAILVFDAGPPPELLDRVNLPGAPYGIAIDNENRRLWVTQTARNRVVEYVIPEEGPAAPKRVRSFRTVQQPNTVAVDPASGLVYVAGRANGVLQAFDPDRAEAQG